MNDLTRRVNAAAGRAPVDLLIVGARVVNVFTGQIMDVDVAIDNGVFVGFGGRPAREVVDAGGMYMLPGLIDAHIHIESTMLSPARFAELALAHGTTTVVADPHELVNVTGVAGIRYFLACAEALPLNLFVSLPSCVPAAPFEDAGAVLCAKDLEPFIDHPHVCAIGEMMNFPGVLAADPDVLAKISLGTARGKIVNGHAPYVAGKELDAYLSTGISDTHEATTQKEAEDMLARGGYVFLREGSAAKNLAELLPVVTAGNARRFAFCCDDRHARDLMAEGEIDHILRLAVRQGLSPVLAVTMATLNAAEALRLRGKGGIAPGWDADFVLVDDLRNFLVRRAYVGGKLVARDGEICVSLPEPDASSIRGAMRVAPLGADAFAVRAPSGRARVIGLTGGSVVTASLVQPVNITADGRVLPSDNPGLSLLAVIERHKMTGLVGAGLLAGYGVRGGAVAISIAHDSHNIVVAGDTESAMHAAAAEVIRLGGGCALCRGTQVIGSLALPLGGLMTDEPPSAVSRRLDELTRRAHDTLGIPEDVAPFMSLSFMTLPVIPSLKLTARGLFDVDAFAFTSVDVCD